jgi:CubicO group peptidase (beta-lactamase class C family)
MNEIAQELARFAAELAGNLGVPGAAVGVWADGQETYACYGVTSTDNPLPVSRDTMFVLGSVSKTYTATAVMCLAADGRVDLAAPVRWYVPEFTLADAGAAERVTVLQLLNHTAGFATRLGAETGEGDDALAKYVTAMAGSELISAPGARASYSQMGFNLLGRVIEKVTGLTFEQAVELLLLRPIGLPHSAYALNDVTTKRFAVGHNTAGDGTLTVVSQWKDSRANNPGGGLVSSVSDLLRWARFHLGDGRAGDGTLVLPADALRQMRRQTAELRGSTLGDGIGLCWFLRDIGGVATIGHGGSANGQFADLLIVPERDFAVAVTSNLGPDAGLQFNQAVVRWALEHYLGVADRDPEPLPYDAVRAAEVAGSYENEIMRLIVAGEGSGLTVECLIKPEVRAASGTELPPDLPAAALGLLPGDECIVTAGGLKGQRGFFTRDDSHSVTGIDLAGRLFTRTR